MKCGSLSIINSLHHYGEINNVTFELWSPPSFYYKAFPASTRMNTRAQLKPNKHV